MKKWNNILIVVLFVMVSTSQSGQIPNQGFENWTNTGTYMRPDGWWTTNDSVASGDFYPVTRSTDHYPPDIGAYSLRMENSPELYPDWASFGVAWTGDFAGNNNPVFPVIGHPTSLLGYYKFLPENEDTFEMHVQLYYDGLEIGVGRFKTAEEVSEWTPFEVIFSDYIEADSARIFFSSCYDNDDPIPKGNSILYVDNLNFDSLTTSVFTEMEEVSKILLYPNPASIELNLSLNCSPQGKGVISIYNSFGQNLLSQKTVNCQTTTILDISHIPAGIYLVFANFDFGVHQHKKLVIME